MVLLGNCLSQQGLHDEAQQAHERSLSILEETVGPLHQDTVLARINFGGTLSAAGKLSAAAEQTARAIEDGVVALGPEHLHMAFARNNYGRILNDMARYAEAAVQLRAALATRETLLGPDAPRTLATKATLQIAIDGQANAAELLPAAMDVPE